jgi:hypothetical protein
MDMDDKTELEARRKGYVQPGVYVHVDIDARVITEDLIKSWDPEDLLLVYEEIGDFLKRNHSYLLSAKKLAEEPKCHQP